MGDTGMALNEIEKLIQRVAQASDPGEDLENADAFRRIESLISDDETDWAEVETASLDLLEKSLDLRIVVALAGASLRDPQRGLSCFRASLTLLRTMLETHPESAHPKPHPEAPLSALRTRAMSIDELGSPFGTAGDEYEIVARIRLLPLTSAGDVFTLRDRMILRGELANVTLEEEDKASQQVAFDAAMAQTASRNRPRLEAMLSDAHRSLHEVEEIERVFDKSCAGVGDAPRLDMDALKEQLRQVMSPFEEALGSTSELSADGTSQDDQATGGAEAAGSYASGALATPSHSGTHSGGGVEAVNSRADVLVAIQAIQKYYRENEPSSPVPLLLQRASRFVNMNFVDIVEDIAGESVENLQVLFGANDSGSDNTDNSGNGSESTDD